MRGAVGVRAHLLQPRDPVKLQTIRQRGANAGMILMIARAFQLDWLAVEKKALIGIEANAANAECGLLAVRGHTSTCDCRYQTIEVWFVDRPEFGTRQSCLCLEFAASPGFKFCRLGLGGGYRLAIGVENGPCHTTELILLALILNFAAHGNKSRLRAHL